MKSKHATYAQSPFTEQLRINIISKIRGLHNEGTVGISVENLRQMVKTPSDQLHGAPRGTNASYFYAQDFRDVCNSPEIRGFIIGAEGSK